MKAEDRILINISGTGYDLQVGKLNGADYEQLLNFEKESKSSLNNVLFDDNFYLKNSLSENYKSWRDFNFASYKGADLFQKGQIEIWVNRKRKKTYPISKIENSPLLFPLFNTN